MTGIDGCLAARRSNIAGGRAMLPVHTRRLSLEVLEQRMALATLSGDSSQDPPAESLAPALVAPLAQAPITMTALELLVNGAAVRIDQSESVFTLQPGDTLQVAGIHYSVDSAAIGLEGVVAMEGYLRRMDAAGDSAFDYADGRFGNPDTLEPIVPGEVRHSGLAGSWTAELGDDGLVIALVRYFGDSAVTESRFFVQLRVGVPNFDLSASLNASVHSQHPTVGQPLSIEGFWSNVGDGRYRNYTEVDVFYESLPETPIWVGTLSGVAGPGGTVSGEFRNDNPDDPFAEQWTPLLPGKYVLRFAVDPEEFFEGQSEHHNVIEVRLTVKK